MITVPSHQQVQELARMGRLRPVSPGHNHLQVVRVLPECPETNCLPNQRLCQFCQAQTIAGPAYPSTPTGGGRAFLWQEVRELLRLAEDKAPGMTNPAVLMEAMGKMKELLGVPSPWLGSSF